MFKNFSWGHGVIAALGTFICFILFMILVFPNGKQNSELVSNNYYEDELQYQSIIDAKNNADHLSTRPVFGQDSYGFTLQFPPKTTPDQNKVQILLFRTDDANLDVKKELILDAKHQIKVPSKILTKGSYTLKMSWKENKKQFQIDYDVLWK